MPNVPFPIEKPKLTRNGHVTYIMYTSDATTLTPDLNQERNSQLAEALPLIYTACCTQVIVVYLQFIYEPILSLIVLVSERHRIESKLNLHMTEWAWLRHTPVS